MIFNHARISGREIEAAIFDLDGTLIDSMHLWENFSSDWLRSFGKTPGKTLAADIYSMTFSQCADYFKKNYDLDLSRDELISQWGDGMTERYIKGAILKQGVKELLDAFSEKRIKMGIATYSLPRACEAILCHHKIRSYFSSIIYAYEFEDVTKFSSVKKDPQFWLAAAGRLGTEPEKCIVFEDSFTSFEGVKPAGMCFAAVYDSSAGRWPLLSISADISLQYPGEALRYF